MTDTHEYKLNEETLRLINQTIMALNAEQREHQEVWETKQTETWRQSDRGVKVGEWIDEISDLADEMDSLRGKA